LAEVTSAAASAETSDHSFFITDNGSQLYAGRDFNH
jgi:hypothetical protein